MSQAAIAPAVAARHRQRSPLQRSVVIGLIFGTIAVYVAAVGLLPSLDARWIIVNVVSLGEWDPLESTCRHASLSIL